MRGVEHAGEPRQHVGAEPAELAAADLGFGPRADDRPVALVEIGERARSTRCSAARPVGARLERSERLGERLHLVGDLGRERAEQVFLVGEVQVEGAVRGLARASRCRRRGPRSSPSSRTPRRRRRGAGASCAGPGPAAPGRPARRRARGRGGRGLTPSARASGGSLRAGHGVRVRGPDARVTFRAARPDWAGPAPLRSDADVSVIRRAQ